MIQLDKKRWCFVVDKDGRRKLFVLIFLINSLILASYGLILVLTEKNLLGFASIPFSAFNLALARSLHLKRIGHD